MGIPARVPRTLNPQTCPTPQDAEYHAAASGLLSLGTGDIWPGNSLLWRLFCIVVCLAAHSLVGSTHQMPVVPPPSPLGIAQVPWGAKSLWSSPGHTTVITRQYPRPMPCASSTCSSHCGQADRIPTRQKLSLILPSRTLPRQGGQAPPDSEIPSALWLCWVPATMGHRLGGGAGPGGHLAGNGGTYPHYHCF